MLVDFFLLGLVVLRSVVNKVVLGAARYVCVCFVNSSVVLLVVLG